MHSPEAVLIRPGRRCRLLSKRGSPPQEPNIKKSDTQLKFLCLFGGTTLVVERENRIESCLSAQWLRLPVVAGALTRIPKEIDLRGLIMCDVQPSDTVPLPNDLRFLQTAQQIIDCKDIEVHFDERGAVHKVKHKWICAHRSPQP
jgi:hypothetical protein